MKWNKRRRCFAKHWEKMKVDTEIKASDAEIAVLQAFAEQDGMESYFEKAKARTQLPGER